jgi:hypothetical protein
MLSGNVKLGLTPKGAEAARRARRGLGLADDGGVGLCGARHRARPLPRSGVRDLPSRRDINEHDSNIHGIAESTFIQVLKAYREKRLDNAVMQNIAGRLKDDEIEALAAYFFITRPRGRNDE